MRRTQRGITFVGWLVLLAPWAIMVYAGIRLTPIYLNYLSVSNSLGTLPRSVSPGSEPNKGQEIRNALQRRFEIENIEHPAVGDIDVHREGETWVAIADYDDTTVLFANITLQLHFHKEVDLP